MATKRKTTTAIVAGVTAAALLLGGTFAWTSISQQAKNEAIVDINPGGRLHDDFNGTNKDVYVENFGDETTGVPIFARIRLYEYMEIGQQAGEKGDITDKKANSLIKGDNINETAGWEIYKYGTESVFSKYWTWKLGNDDADTLPYYMPTFNKNKDSLKADINGTYEGRVDGDIVHYDDYVEYKQGGSSTQDATYDWDSDTDDEPNPSSISDRSEPIDSADVLKENETHNVTQISTTSTIMSMAEWKDAGSPIGPIWVFDTDGWAYWAQPIEPGETTGLLLDSISLKKVPDDNYYYGINVVGQFATAGDISEFNSGEPGSNLTWTSDAEALFDKITGTASSEDDNTMQELELTIEGDNSIEISFGDSVSITMDDTGLADGQTADITDVTVSYEDPDADPTEVILESGTDYTYEDNVLTITDTTLAGQTLTVKDANGVVSGTLTVTAESSEPENPSETPTYYTMDVAYPLESGTTVNLGVPDYTDETPDDSVSYYIINKTNNPTGGSATELEAKDGMKVVPITFVSGGGLITETKYYYAVPFENGTAVTTDAAVEGITLVAMDGDNVVAFTCTKVYDATVHTYLGVGNYSYVLEGVTQYTGCLVFESVANKGSYCTLGDANIGVDGDDKFVVTTGVTAAADDADYDYEVETITETDCTCTASTN